MSVFVIVTAGGIWHMAQDWNMFCARVSIIPFPKPPRPAGPIICTIIPATLASAGLVLFVLSIINPFNT
jgi:hypothetical protein